MLCMMSCIIWNPVNRYARCWLSQNQMDVVCMPLGKGPVVMPASEQWWWNWYGSLMSWHASRLICWSLGVNGKRHDAGVRHIPLLQSAAVAEFYVWLKSLCVRFSSQPLCCKPNTAKWENHCCFRPAHWQFLLLLFHSVNQNCTNNLLEEVWAVAW